jgi:hypothetical protein
MSVYVKEFWRILGGKPGDSTGVSDGTIKEAASRIYRLSQARADFMKAVAIDPNILRTRIEVEATVEIMEEKIRLGREKKPTEQEALVERELRERMVPRQACKHLKGGGMLAGKMWDKYDGPQNHRSVDYSVATHRFPDGKTKIWCLQGCGFESWTGDANWAEAVHMAESSTNCQSSSEMLIKIDKVKK